MAQDIYDPFQGNDINDEEDSFHCGKCRIQFTSFAGFMLHKKSHLLDNLTAEQKTLTEGLNMMGDVDLLSFNLDLASDQVLSTLVSDETLIVPQPAHVTGSFQMDSSTIPHIVVAMEAPYLLPDDSTTIAIGDDSVYAVDQSAADTPISCLLEDQLIVSTTSSEDQEMRGESSEGGLSAAGNKKGRILSKAYKLKCGFCAKMFTKNFDLQQHLRTHTGERPFQCVICGKMFTQKSNVKKHIETHKSWPMKVVTLSNDAVQTIEDQMSGAVVVVVDDSFACQYCPLKFNTFNQLKTHRKTHSDDKVYKCPQQCKTFFRTVAELLDHLQGHPASEYSCQRCTQTFPSLDELGQHQAVHPALNAKKKSSMYTCKECNNKFSSQVALARHMELVGHKYTCKVCHKEFKCERYLRRHLVIHNTEARHTCAECGKQFKTAQNLNVHQVVHSSDKPFACKKCDSKFARQDHLIRHLLIHDPINKTYKCPFNDNKTCDKVFERKDKLKQHILTHTSVRLQCARCRKVFKRQSQMSKHELVCLSEERPCKDCGHVTNKLDNYKKSPMKTKGTKNKRKSKLEVREGVSTLEVVVVPLRTSASRTELES